MSNNNNSPVVTIVATEDDLKNLRYAADVARREVRAEVKTAGFWDGVVAAHGTGKKNADGRPQRAAIVRAVLEIAGEYRDDAPQSDANGDRTEYGNVVQKFGYHFDQAVKRATGEPTKKPDYLALAVQAAGTAHTKGEVDVETILTAIRASLIGNDAK